MKPSTFLKILISVSALAMLYVSIRWPEVKIDAITVALMLLIFLPWVVPILKSAEIPGVGKVEFKEMEKAGDLIDQPDSATEKTLETRKASYLAISERDPTLAIVGLRIELEKRLRDLATKNGIRDDQPLKKIVVELKDSGVLTDPSEKGISTILDAGNRAAHGAEVDEKVIDWVIKQGGRILSVLDALLSSSKFEDREGSLSRAIVVVEFEGPDFAEHCISFLRLAMREGSTNLRLGYPSEKTRAGQSLIKMGALIPYGEESTRTGSIRLTITPLGEALLTHLLQASYGKTD